MEFNLATDFYPTTISSKMDFVFFRIFLDFFALVVSLWTIGISDRIVIAPLQITIFSKLLLLSLANKLPLPVVDIGSIVVCVSKPDNGVQ